MVVSSLGPRGWPHSMPMWFLVRDGEIWVWTYAKSQKVRNLERDPRATLLIETGDRVHRAARDPDRGRGRADPRHRSGSPSSASELAIRYTEGIDSIEGDAAAALEAQAAKRVAIRFSPIRTATWDHRKLGGTY